MASLGGRGVLVVTLLTVLGTTLALECIQTDECMTHFASDASVVGHELEVFCGKVREAIECMRTKEGNCKTEEERRYNQQQIKEITDQNPQCAGGMLWRASGVLVLATLLAGWCLQRL